MFKSWARGAEASTPPTQDAFRDVFANHLLARLTARNNDLGGTDRSWSRPASPQNTNHSLSQTSNYRQDDTRCKPKNDGSQVQAPSKEGDATRGTSSSEESRQVAAAREKRRQELHKTPHKPESQTPTAGLAPDQNQAIAQNSQNQGGGTAATTPQALRDLITFLQSFPGGSLKISPEQAPAVASYLKSAGLPQGEIDRLLTPAAGTQEISLNAGDLQTAWQRVAETAPATAAAPGQNPPPAAANQPKVEASQPQQAQEIQQTPGYRALWERLTLPQNMIPTVRLALARLGASPEALDQLDEKGQNQGIPLTRVWQILQGIKDNLPATGAGAPSGAATGAGASQSAVIGQQPVSGAEMEAWRQVLTQAGLKPEVVEKLLGQKSPGTQEELKTSLLAAAPTEEAPSALAEPKPLYQPQNLQMRPFFWQSQDGGDQPQLSGEGSGEKGQGPAAQLATPMPTPAVPTMGGNLALSTFQALFQGIAQEATGGAAAPLSETGPTWPQLPPEVQESLWTQLQSGVTSNLGQGESQVTLNLNPPELGQIQLTLNLSGQDLSVTAVATRPEAAQLASLGMPQLVQALAQQGLVLTDFQVRLQDQPDRPVAPVLAGTRDKGGATGGNSSASSRRRSGEVDRFV